MTGTGVIAVDIIMGDSGVSNDSGGGRGWIGFSDRLLLGGRVVLEGRVEVSVPSSSSLHVVVVDERCGGCDCAC